MSAAVALLRRDAVAALFEVLDPDAPMVLANGYISRDGFDRAARSNHFYMLGSMGLAASIALGAALARPDLRLVVLDGDGNLLMGMGILPMVGQWRPRRFLHVVLDNGTYGSTGAQPTVSPSTDFAAAALACGYERAAVVDEAAELRRLAGAWQELEGPSLLHVRVSAHEPPPGRRVDVEPAEIARRFGAALRGEAGR